MSGYFRIRAGLAGGLMLALLVTSTPAAATSPSWKVVPSPNVGTGENVLFGIAALSDTNIWASGSYFDETLKATRTLIEHWNGSSWSVVPSPNVGTGNNNLGTLAAVCSTDIWVVGASSATVSSQPAPLIERWNGTKWTVAKSPTIAGYLNGVLALSASNVWAVGDSIDSHGNYHTLIEHWNGVGWSIVSSPSRSTSSSALVGIAAVSAADIWAVGSYYNDAQNMDQTLVEHWNGSSWSVVPSPNSSPTGNWFSQVTAISSTDIWAVGDQYNAQEFTDTLTEHWNGKTWSVVPGPGGRSHGGELLGVLGLSSTDVWAAGFTCDSGCFELQHWDGTSWSNVVSPQLASSLLLTRLARVPGTTQLWAVGFFPRNGTNQTLIEHYS